MELYVITDERLIAREMFTVQVEHALCGGARWVQFREKHSSREERKRLGTELRTACDRYGAKLIVNDSPVLAKEIGADGVHLGKGDPSVEAARMLLGDEAIVGISCYNDLSLALEAERQGADYAAFGSFFPSQVKPGAVHAPLELLSKAKAALKIPVCCIGGIAPANVRELAVRGADMIAVCGAVFSMNDPQAAAEEFRKVIESCSTTELKDSLSV
ncbi:MAG TPA: thiamine phosphate synthase [Candidatus Kapabacteria bacterium]|nr:thiamine phosphate synthase [Candidatus Kapabacteria bacterium]